MKALSKTAQSIKPSAVMVIDNMIRQLRESGERVYAFGGGEPDFISGNPIRQAGIEAIQAGKTKYTPVAGLPELRQAIADRLRADFNIQYNKEQIAVTSGGKLAVFGAMNVLAGPGDEVILPAPYWISYYQQICMVGAVPVVVNTSAENGFKITAQQLEAAVTEKSKVFILNNPGNPSGAVYSRSELCELAEVCKKHDLYIISDEMYGKLVFDKTEFTSFASLDEDVKNRTVLVNGASKAYAMTGWRIGYAAANEDITKAISSWLSHACGCASSISQYAAIRAFSVDQGYVAEMCASYQQRRDYIVDRIRNMPFVDCIRPEGAFYFWIRVDALYGKTLGGREIHSDADFVTAMLNTVHVAVLPGEAFGMPGYVRWCFAASLDELKSGLDRMESFIG